MLINKRKLSSVKLIKNKLTMIYNKVNIKKQGLILRNVRLR